MKTRRDAVAEQVYSLVKVRAKRKGCRVKKLQEQSARDAVTNGAAWRLMQIDAVFPHALRRRLKPRRFGNIAVRNIDPLLWAAWVLVHRYYIERGSFWDEDGAERDALIDRAIDAELKSYTRDTAASGGTAAGALIDYSALESLYGNELAMEPSYELEKQEAEAEAVKEFEILRQEINAYSRTLPRVQRKAFWWICNPGDEELTNSTIAARVSVSECRGIGQDKVRKLRAKFKAMATKFLPVEEGAVETLIRKVEILEKEMAVLRAERRRDTFLRDHSPEEYNALRAWAAPFCEALGQSVDDMLGVTIEPKPST